MEIKEACKLIGKRAMEISKNDKVISHLKQLYIDGTIKTQEEIEKIVYNLAIATLYGKPKN